MDLTVVVVTGIRLLNAILWTIIVVRSARAHLSFESFVTRRLVGMLIVFLMWSLVVGGLASLGFLPGDVARSVNTAFAAFAAIIALALITEKGRS